MADKLIYNAKVYLSRGKFTEAVHIRDGKILAVGESGALLGSASSGSEKIDAEGKLLLPGFYDCHEHLIMAGKLAHSISADVSSIDALISAGRETIARNRVQQGAFVTGMGWDDAKLGRYPTRQDLDKISQSHAVAISRRCGHIVACNTLALQRAGIDPTGHDGILREQEARPLHEAIPEDSEDDQIVYAQTATAVARSFGVTSIASNDAWGGDIEPLTRIYAKVFEHPESRVRVTLQCAIRTEQDLDGYIASGYRTGTQLIGDRLKIGPLKLFADGSLGSRTALVRQSYRDSAGNHGVAVLDAETLKRYVYKANANGLSVAVHAIGDGAIDNVLSAYEAAAQGGTNPLRNGIIHCQITDEDLLSRFVSGGILALIQPVFLGSDRHIIESRVGKELARTSYAWSTMEKLGIRTAYGTDCPVESPNPFRNIAAAVGRFGYHTDESVDVATAVDAYTLGTAYANFDENRVGRIAAGYLADLVLVDRDIFELPPEEIANAKAALVIGG